MNEWRFPHQGSFLLNSQLIKDTSTNLKFKFWQHQRLRNNLDCWERYENRGTKITGYLCEARLSFSALMATYVVKLLHFRVMSDMHYNDN